MPGKAPSGKKSLGNGVKDSSSTSKKSKEAKNKAAKDVEEEMTVVVPPTRGSKKSQKATPVADADGNVDMDEPNKLENTTAKIDPVTQTIYGNQYYLLLFSFMCCNFIGLLHTYHRFYYSFGRQIC